MRLRSQKKLHKVVQDAVKKMPEVRDKQKEGFKAVLEEPKKRPLTRQTVIEHQQADPVFAKIIMLLSKQKQPSSAEQLLSEIANRNY